MFGANLPYVLILLRLVYGSARNEPQEVREFLDRYNERGPIYLNYMCRADWNYQTNLTEANEKLALEAQDKEQKYSESMSNEANQFDLTELDEDMRRQIEKIRFVNLDDERRQRLNKILSEMSNIYGSAKVCRANGECLPLDPDLQSIMAKSKNVTELKWAWEGWHNNVGRQLKPLYLEYVQLKNELAELNGYHDYGQLLRDKYETAEFEDDIDDLWEETKDYYKQLHTYVRRKLYEQYGPEHVNLTGPIPQHLLGDMWGRFWNNMYPILEPYDVPVSVDPTPQLIAQNYTVIRLFQTAQHFYTSLGLFQLPETFYKNSMLEKPEDREVICHPTAWDMYDGKDFRIKMCTEIDFEYFKTIHHEMGHTQYQMQYAHQPLAFRDGANDGFHEAIGEVMSMSVSTPAHLYAIGLANEINTDPKTDINFLLLQSLTSLSTLPFHYVMDKIRWRMFDGELNVTEWNNIFWEYVREHVGVVPPVERDDELDLDVTTIFHVCNDFDMIRYFTRTILQFQFNDALCKVVGIDLDPWACDIYESKEAGHLLSKMMRMGSSRPWPEALEQLTGESKMNAKHIKRYFRLLNDWLTKANKENGDCIGWDADCE